MQKEKLPKETLTIEIAGDPQPQKRHRHTKHGNFVRVYDPSQKDKEALCKKVQQHISQQAITWQICQSDIYEVSLLFLTPLPSLSQRQKNLIEWTQNHTAKPDLDNLEKFVLDSLKGTLWLDDKQITKLGSSKIFTSKPRTVITVSKITREPLTHEQEAILEIFSKESCQQLKRKVLELAYYVSRHGEDPSEANTNSAVAVLTELINELYPPLKKAKEILCPSKKAKAKK